MQRKAPTRTLQIAAAGCAGALMAAGGCSYTPRDAFYDSRKVVYSSRPGTGETVSRGNTQTLTDARRR